MNGIDVTSSVYNTSTGKINISSCTGNIVITEGEVTTYTITANVTNGLHTGSASIVSGGTATVTISPNEGYKLPTDVTVTGTSKSYNSSTGVITLSNPTGNVTISAICTQIVSYDITANVTNGSSSGDTGKFKYTNRSVPATQGDRRFMTKVGTNYVGTNATDVTTQQKECLSVDFGYKG